MGVKTGPKKNVRLYIWRGSGVPTEKDFLDAPPFTIFPSHTDLGRRRLPVSENIDFGGGVKEPAWWAGERGPTYDEEVHAVLREAGLATEYLTDIIDVPDDLQGQVVAIEGRRPRGRARVKLAGAYQAYPWAVERGYTLIKVPDALTGEKAKYAEVFILDESRSKGDKYWMVQTPRRDEWASYATRRFTNPEGGAEAAIRQFLDESGDELDGDRDTAQFFPAPEGELVLRVVYPGYMSTLLLGGHGTTTDDRMIEVLRELLRQQGYRPTWSQQKGGGKWRVFRFRPEQRQNPAQGWRLEHATFIAQELAGPLIAGVRDELLSDEPLTPPAAQDLLVAYGFMYQAHFIALALGATPLAAQIGDAMEGIAAGLGNGCGVGSNVGALGRPKPPPLANPQAVVLAPDATAKAASEAIADLKKAEDESVSFSDRFPAMLSGMGSVTLAAAAAHDHGDLQLRGQMEDVKDKLIQALGQGCGTQNLARIEAGTAGSFSRRWGSGAKKKKGKKKKANPTPERHRRAYNAYIQSAGHHLQRGAELLEKGRRLPAFRALRHAECDIRQAYTEAVYSKQDDADLQAMTGPLESLYQGVQGQLRELEARL